jgi:SAM-dependent methyltransferase
VTPPATGSFDELAETYDRFRTGYAPEVYDAIIRHGLKPPAHVIDVGCGTGLVSAELVARGCTVTGVDVSEPMLERARARVPSATFIASRAEKLPFDDATFDAATSAQAFHWFDQGHALAEAARVVRPGGVIAVWWKTLMRGDGMRLVREEIARDLGLSPPRDLLVAGFGDFERSALVDRRLRVIPWRVRMTIAAFLGIERSRARSRDAYGDKLEAYLTRLAERLGPLDEVVSVSYLHMLYLGRVAAKR